MLLSACSGGGSALTPGAADSHGGGLKHPTETLGGLPLLPIDINLGDAAPRLGSLLPTEIDLGISEVDVVSDGTVQPLVKYARPHMINVLAAQDHPRSIGIGAVWSNQYQQVRFVVNVASSKVVAGGADYPISFPTAEIAPGSVLANGSTTTEALSPGSIAMSVSGAFVDGTDPASSIEADFNAFESLALNGAGDVEARPTLFAVPSDKAGKLAGTVVNGSGAGVSGATLVAFDANGQVANTDNTDATGAFKMHTLTAGTYHLMLYNSYRTSAGQSIASANASDAAPAIVDAGYVTVAAGQTTDVPAVND
ncbi:MAG TPA: carboxypeptidase regulatory-like domain-containing protein [Candidatus Baltobacteraceae bacterium]